MEYYIYITNNCNLNCAYCSVLFDIKKYKIPLSPVYNFGVLKNFIENTQKKFKDRVANVYFFGGEPTTDYTTIDQLINILLAETKFKVNFIMHTNGLLINKASNFILENLNLALISINYEKIYNSQQKMSEYYPQIINGIKKIRSVKPIPIIGRLTISPNTNLYDECCLAGNFFDYVYWQLDNSNTIANYKEYANQYKTQVGVLYDYWLSFLEAGIFLKYVPFMSVISRILNNSVKPDKFFCGYGNSQIYIQTDGKCYACCDNVQTSKHFIGDIYNGIEFKNSYIKNTICESCNYLNLCGGRCGRMHLDFGQERILQFCELNQFMFDLIKNSLPKLKDIFKKYPRYLKLVNDKNMAYTEYTP